MNNTNNRNLPSRNNGSYKVTNSNNATYSHTTPDDEESRILSWVSPLESWRRHSDVARTRAGGIGEWVLQSSEFQAWRQDGNHLSAGRVLFCQGAPGAGKTFTCSLVIDMLCDETVGQNVMVGCLYCDYRGQREQTAEVMIGSLLRQFVTALPKIPGAVTRAFRSTKPHLRGRVPELAKMIELFPAVLGQFRQVFICVDALDEFVPEYRTRFLRSLYQILYKSPNTKLFLTARPYIQSELESNIPLHMRVITIQPLFSDVERYLMTKLDADLHPSEMDDGLRSEIMTKILRESSEIFLLVKLQIDSILGEITISGRRKKLYEITEKLSDAYTAALEGIKGQRGVLARLGISTLMWISLAERPLLIDELCHALAMELGSTNIDTEMIPPIETVEECCMGLVTIDHASSTVRLVHATLQEYLRGHQYRVFQNPHSTIAWVCLSYLGTESVRKLPPDLRAAPLAFPFLGYASCHWGAHAKKELTASVRHLALDILGQYPQHAAANIFLCNPRAPRDRPRSSAGFTGLHYAAYFGIAELLEALLRMEWANPNQMDEWGRTPLILAAEKGNEAVARILISRVDVNPNSVDEMGQTPLALASGGGYEGIVRILLSRAGVSLNSTDQHGNTPLHQASAIGHIGAVKALLSHADINPHPPNWVRQTPLFLAAANGHGGVVRILLSRANVNPNSTDGGGRTPLFRAAENGHDAVVMVLLNYADVNPNLADRDGQTPLSRASVNGHERVAWILLSRADVNPNLVDRFGQAPLFQASGNGHEGVVRMLLSRAEVNPNSTGGGGRTPLFRAAENGHDGVVRALLSRTDVNPNSPDGLDRTPLFQATVYGHEGVVRMLLSRADVNHNSVNLFGQTPFSIASLHRRFGIVSLLKARR